MLHGAARDNGLAANAAAVILLGSWGCRLGRKLCWGLNGAAG
jgi:hypothetical protein